ncbi:hypothetical protein COLO4_13124 [Corchorus olitorius]|uniref:Uncharacterized protein n=1 Tax=Corchorus olitorius TaxID=93759 RepID=A0A1R3JYD0_9ROSI|nr:hypothetical protein COLO4_13124 [Corchorus olitorius]
MLCGSTAAYFASKFLGLFGLSLPCPCNGLYGYRDKNLCFQSILVNEPSHKIFSVQSSVRKKLPFDSIWSNFYDDEDEEHRHSQSNLEKWPSGSIELEAEASSCSMNAKKNLVGVDGHFGKVSSFPYDPLASITTSTDGKCGNDITDWSRTSGNSEGDDSFLRFQFKGLKEKV